MSLFRWSPRIAQYPSLRKIPPLIMGEGIPVTGRERKTRALQSNKKLSHKWCPEGRGFLP
jgi:hypothetical protein